MRARLGFWLIIGLIVGPILAATSTASAPGAASGRAPSTGLLSTGQPLAGQLWTGQASTGQLLAGQLSTGQLSTGRTSAVAGLTVFVPRTFTVLGAGDILLHQGLWRQGHVDAAAARRKGYDFDPIFASAEPRIQAADLAICHMETPYGPKKGPFSGYPVFAVPPAIATTIHDIGYDTCSTASNHSLDDGEAGIDRTLDDLDAAGVKHTGTARSAMEADTPDILDVNGVNVAQLSYAYGFNGIPLPPGKPWLANVIDVKNILAAAARAKADGADVVVVSLHWGTQYETAPNAQQLSVAKALLASSDIDLILGCHAHVVQPFQKIDGKWVAYGMGNQVATQGFSQATMDGVMPEFTFTEVTPGHFEVTKAEAIPTYDELGAPIRLIDISAALAKPGLSATRRAAYIKSWKHTEHTVDAMGAEKDGLVIAPD